MQNQLYYVYKSEPALRLQNNLEYDPILSNTPVEILVEQNEEIIDYGTSGSIMADILPQDDFSLLCLHDNSTRVWRMAKTMITETNIDGAIKSDTIKDIVKLLKEKTNCDYNNCELPSGDRFYDITVRTRDGKFVGKASGECKDLRSDTIICITIEPINSFV